MAKLGISKMQELIGRTDLLKKYDSKENNFGKSNVHYETKLVLKIIVILFSIIS